VVIRRGVIAASQGGKLKTLLQVAAICLYILPASLSPPAWVREVVMAVAVVVTLVTGADYVVRAARLYRGPVVPGPGPNGTSGTNGASTGNGGGADG
jgi:CDP-diacylglycerol---glycerol-3-phosphate 3-phosphatidyltransferase